MDKFKGKNDLKSTKELFYERLRYKVFARPRDSDLTSYKNFQDYEMVFFGRVDSFLTPIVLNQKFLKKVKSGSTSEKRALRLVKPVADAANDFIKEYQRAYTQKKIDTNDPFLSNIVPKKAYVGYHGVYLKHVRKVFDIFLNTYALNNEQRYGGLVNFSQFADAFVDFNMLSGIAIMPSSFIKTRACDPFVSGLMFAIADQPADVDQGKYDNFLNSFNSTFYRKMATKYGFSIDINKPWTLVADLGSPAMQPYLEKYMSDPSQAAFFANFYDRAFIDDIEVFQTQFLTFYNAFASSRSRKVTVTEEDGHKIKRTYKRQPKTMDELLAAYDDYFWVDLYLRIKVSELEPDTVESAKYSEMKEYSKTLLEKKGSLAAVEYIVNELKRYASSQSGSAKRALQRKRQESGQDLTSSPTSAIIRTSTSNGGTGGSSY